MAYRQVYFRIHTKGYSSGWSSDTDRSAFKEESRQLFQELGWTIKLGHNGGCDVVTKDWQDLYLHPTSFSGVIEESTIQPLQKQMQKAQTFHYEGVDCYEEYQDMSDEAYRMALEAKRDEITSYILERCRTKRKNLYIVAPVATDVAAKYEICRLCDKNRDNKIGMKNAVHYNVVPALGVYGGGGQNGSGAGLQFGKVRLLLAHDQAFEGKGLIILFLNRLRLFLRFCRGLFRLLLHFITPDLKF